MTGACSRCDRVLSALLESLQDADVRALAWTIGSPSLFNADHPLWLGRLRTDAWAARELARCADWLIAQDHAPEALRRALGDPLVRTPLGHTFEKLVLFWQATRPDVRAFTHGLMVRSGGRTLGEFDIVLLRHDGVIETLEVTVKYYLSLRPELGIDGCIGPRAFDRMSHKFDKMTTRQTDLGHTEFGRAAIARWLEISCGETHSPDQLIIENFALSRGYVFHPSHDALIPSELSPAHQRGLWQTDATALPDDADADGAMMWRNLASREWLGPYRGPLAESGWPNDPAMPRLYARVVEREAQCRETERRFVVRADAGLLKSVHRDGPVDA